MFFVLLVAMSNIKYFDNVATTYLSIVIYVFVIIKLIDAIYLCIYLYINISCS